ncbi:SPARC-like [Symsagittifera roscoffensis]|uniref:SPARC-like n=1 Tax=Symsagittifera roscoffensis TaxID=84072 RepID=UPI00307BEC55
MEAKTLSVFLSLALTLFSTSLAAEKNDNLDPFNLYSTDDFFNLEGVSFNGSSWVGTGAGLNASCTEEELAQFPMRMRAWLFNIMQQLSSYPESEGGLKESERELLYQAQEMEDSNYIIPVHWKFLTLDTDQSGDIKGEEMTSFISMLNPIDMNDVISI